MVNLAEQLGPRNALAAERTCIVLRSVVASVLGALELAIIDEWEPLTCAGKCVDPETLVVTDVDDVVFISDRETYERVRRRPRWSALEWWRYQYAMRRLRRAGWIAANAPQVWHCTERGWRRRGVRRPDPSDPSRSIDVYERRLLVHQSGHAMRMTRAQMTAMWEVGRRGGARARAGRPRLECDGCHEKPGGLRKVDVDGEQMRLCARCREVTRKVRDDFRARGNCDRSPPPAETKSPLERSFSLYYSSS